MAIAVHWKWSLGGGSLSLEILLDSLYQKGLTDQVDHGEVSNPRGIAS